MPARFQSRSGLDRRISTCRLCISSLEVHSWRPLRNDGALSQLACRLPAPLALTSDTEVHACVTSGGWCSMLPAPFPSWEKVLVWEIAWSDICCPHIELLPLTHQAGSPGPDGKASGREVGADGIIHLVHVLGFQLLTALPRLGTGTKLGICCA